MFVTHSVYEAVYLSTRIVVMGARPGRVVSEHPVALPAERSDSTRASPAYLAACREVSAALGAAMERDFA